LLYARYAVLSRHADPAAIEARLFGFIEAGL
jgi:hypothetical protein